MIYWTDIVRCPAARDKNWPALAGFPRGPGSDLNINLDVDGLAAVPDDSVDALIACHLIEHLANPVAAIREFQRVIRPGDEWCLFGPERDIRFCSPTHSAGGRAGEIPQPIHPPAVRECTAGAVSTSIAGSPEEFASLIAGLLADGLVNWKLSSLYIPEEPRQIEFGLVLERGSETGRAAGSQFVRDWISAVLRAPGQDPKRIAKFDCCLRRDLAGNDRMDATAAPYEAVIQNRE